jgi:hypothetical protein
MDIKTSHVLILDTEVMLTTYRAVSREGLSKRSQVLLGECKYRRFAYDTGHNGVPPRRRWERRRYAAAPSGDVSPGDGARCPWPGTGGVVDGTDVSGGGVWLWKDPGPIPLLLGS